MPNDASLLLIDRDQAAALLTPDAVMAAVRDSFLLHASREGHVFPVVREPLPDGAVFGIKSGGAASDALLGFKAAGFWPANRKRGADAHQATIMLFDQATGRPQCLIDGNAITTARTAAAGALGLLALARPDSRRLHVFGTGVQAAAHIDYALRALPSLKSVRYTASDGRRVAELETQFAGRCDIAPAAPGAIAQADIVITATPARSPLFEARDIQPGTHINAVGGDTQGKREPPEGLLPLARIWADDLTQSRTIGELQWAPGTQAAELGPLLANDTHARSGAPASDITIFDMTGLALQDLTVARMLMRRALENGTGTSIGWPW
ncbi:MAG TPA: ornithine cyclodeaminase family protein [Pseudoduganella sp.]